MPASLAEEISTPDGKGRYVRRLFATIADRYDLITRVLSYGQDRRWKRRVVALAAPRRGIQALDLATGTGDLAFALAGGGADVVGLDLTFRMIELARLRAPAAAGAHRSQSGPKPAHEAGTFRLNGGRTTFLVGDMLNLPFRDASFDIVTTGYGLRNVPDLTKSIDEIRRVLKPGGRLLSLDFNRPSNVLVRCVYLAYLSAVGGALGWLLHRDPDTYRYIPASIRIYPGAARVAQMMSARGFEGARHLNVLGGLMAIHLATKRAD